MLKGLIEIEVKKVRAEAKRDDWDWTAFIGEVVVNKILSVEVRREISRMVMDRIQQRFDLGVW